MYVAQCPCGKTFHAQEYRSTTMAGISFSYCGLDCLAEITAMFEASYYYPERDREESEKVWKKAGVIIQ